MNNSENNRAGSIAIFIVSGLFIAIYLIFDPGIVNRTLYRFSVNTSIKDSTQINADSTIRSYAPVSLQDGELIYTAQQNKYRHSSSGKSKSGHYYTWVKPHVTRYGKFIPGHLRAKVSTSPKAYNNQARSRYYYQTHKYSRKRK